MLTNEQRIQLMSERLTRELNPDHLSITDESHLHIGHPGAKTGLGHFAVEISSPLFKDKSMVECHRLIYQALGDLMQTDIHALTINCKN